MSNALSVRPLATFCGIRHVPLLAVARNSLFPSLTIESDGLRIRVIRVHDLKFDEIECITLRRRLPYQLTVVPRRGWWTYSANFQFETALKVTAVLQRHAAPLDTTALDFLRRNRRAPANRGL